MIAVMNVSAVSAGPGAPHALKVIMIITAARISDSFFFIFFPSFSNLQKSISYSHYPIKEVFGKVSLSDGSNIGSTQEYIKSFFTGECLYCRTDVNGRNLRLADALISLPASSPSSCGPDRLPACLPGW